MPRRLIGLLTLLALSGVAGTEQQATDLFPAVSKDKTGYINRQGKLTIPCVFEDGKVFSQGLAAVLVDGKWGYVNEKAEIVIKPLYQTAGDFSEDRAWVQVKGKYGYINRDGTVVIEPKYDKAGSFSEGSAVVGIEAGKTMLIDKTGKAAVTPDVYGMDFSGFLEGLVFAYTKDNRYPVYLDKDGKVAVTVEKDTDGFVIEGTAFSEGLAAVRFKGKWGYIDRTGKRVIAPEYARVAPFREGLACVAVEEIKDHVGYWTYFIIDSKGTRLKQIPGAASGGFLEGFVPISTSDTESGKLLYGYMDTRGEMLIRPQFDHALPFQKGLARVQIHGNDAYVDKQGRPVWIGEARRDERITSYSGRSMLDMYTAMLRDENWHVAQLYIQKMNRHELVEGSRKTLEWLLQDPKRTASGDVGRGGVIGMVVVAPFFQTYCRSFVKEGQPIDPSPFRSMLIDKSLDMDFRRSLAECYGHHSFYVTSWGQLAKDAEVLGKLVGDATEDEMIRSEAAETIFTLVHSLYMKYRHETIKDEAATGDKKAQNPDIVGMLDRIPCPFSPDQKVHWEAVVNAMDKAVFRCVETLRRGSDPENKKVSLRFPEGGAGLSSATGYGLIEEDKGNTGGERKGEGKGWLKRPVEGRSYSRLAEVKKARVKDS